MLDAFAPLPLVHGTVGPQHLPVALPIVLVVISFVYVAACPGENTFSMFLIILVIAFICVTVDRLPRALPLALAVLQALVKVANVPLASTPLILTFSMWFSIGVVSSIAVAIAELVCALPVLQAHDPLALIPVAVWPRVYAVAVRFGHVPLADI